MCLLLLCFCFLLCFGFLFSVALWLLVLAFWHCGQVAAAVMHRLLLLLLCGFWF